MKCQLEVTIIGFAFDLNYLASSVTHRKNAIALCWHPLPLIHSFLHDRRLVKQKRRHSTCIRFGAFFSEIPTYYRFARFLLRQKPACQLADEVDIDLVFVAIGHRPKRIAIDDFLFIATLP